MNDNNNNILLFTNQNIDIIDIIIDIILSMFLFDLSGTRTIHKSSGAEFREAERRNGPSRRIEQSQVCLDHVDHAWYCLCRLRQYDHLHEVLPEEKELLKA